jgi:hypothetical protein
MKHAAKPFQILPIMAQRRAMEAAAEANLQTREGHAYKVSFERTYREFAQQCARIGKESVTQGEGKFETLTSVGAKGTVEDVKNPIDQSGCRVFVRETARVPTRTGDALRSPAASPVFGKA